MSAAKQDAVVAPRRSEEFKPDAVRLVTEEEYPFAAAAKAVGVSEQTLRAWRKKFGSRPRPRPCPNQRRP